MKPRHEKAATILSDAELHLRDLISDAATGGDYDTVRQLSIIAERLASERNSLLGIPAPSVHEVLARARGNASASRKTGRGRPSAAASAGYPRFELRNGVLSKVGWSKKTRGEYEQRLPWEVYERTIQALASLTKGRASVVTAEQILAALGESGDQGTPAYQVYIVLALLRQKGVVEKRGREGYRLLAPPSDLVARSQSLWETIGDVS
jgi:hypothetical protein